MVQGVGDATGPGGVDSSGILEAMETLSQVGLAQASTESYYPEDGDGCRADPELASRGVGAVDSVRIAPSLWQKWVPAGLREEYHEWQEEQEPMVSKGRGVKEMLEAIRVAGGLKAMGDCKATGRAVVIPKNSEKCSMIFNCKDRIHEGGVKPKGFRLP